MVWVYIIRKSKVRKRKKAAEEAERKKTLKSLDQTESARWVEHFLVIITPSHLRVIFLYGVQWPTVGPINTGSPYCAYYNWAYISELNHPPPFTKLKRGEILTTVTISNALKWRQWCHFVSPILYTTMSNVFFPICAVIGIPVVIWRDYLWKPSKM